MSGKTTNSNLAARHANAFSGAAIEPQEMHFKLYSGYGISKYAGTSTVLTFVEFMRAPSDTL